jgi:AraC-like DNA-binding protein
VLSYIERRPPPKLAPHLECLWAVSGRATSGPRPPDRVIPDGCPELIVHLGDPFARQVGTRWVVQPRVFLAGTLTRPWLLRAGRRVDTLGLRFRPGAAAHVFDVNMQEWTDCEAPLGRLVTPRAARRLVDGLRDARTRERRFALAEGWLTERVTARSSRRTSARPVVDAVIRTRGQVRIEELARSLGWTRRRVERAFARDLGIRPKMFARIVRLNAVLAARTENERAGIVDLALSAGYFDQSHLLRDFRTLAGRVPHADRGADGELARHFTDPRRLQALLAGE